MIQIMEDLLKKKISLLTKPYWNYKDIMFYCDVKKTRAYGIMGECKDHHDGIIRYMGDCVTADSVMSFLGTTREKEIRIIREIYDEQKELHIN